MTAALLEEALLAGRVAADVPLPDAFRAQLNDTDEPLHGMLREITPRSARRHRHDPVNLQPGDYLLDEGDAWLRVRFVEHGATGSRVHTSAGVGVFVPAGRPVWVWRAVDVMVWACLGGVAR